MDHRTELQQILMGINGVKHVYHNPPSRGMEYPCILFRRAERTAEYANNKKYIKHEDYTITFITQDERTAPDVLDQLEALRYCDASGRPYVKDGLYHYVYSITF